MPTRAEDNPFPYITVVEETEPAAADSGTQRLYIDSTTHKLKATNSSGTDRTIEGVASGAITSSGLTQATARLLGRTTASTGAIEEISVGTGLSLSSGSLTATGGSGNVATDTIWDAAGDLVQGTGADTAAKLSAGSAGQMLRSAGAAAANLWAYPPGYEVAYAQITTAVTVSATTEGGANTVVATSSATYENVPYMVEIYSPRSDQNGGTLVCDIYVDSTILGRIGVTSAAIIPIAGSIRYTPSAGSHTFTWKAWRATANPVIDADVGGTGKSIAAYIRVTKV